MASFKVLTIATISILVLMTSFVMISEDSEGTPIESDIQDAVDDYASGIGPNTFEILAGTYTIGTTVYLPALKPGQTFTIKGVGINTSLGPFSGSSAHCFEINANNKGTYVFQNMYVPSTWDPYSAEFIAGGGTQSNLQFVDVKFFANYHADLITATLGYLKVERCNIGGYGRVIPSPVDKVEIIDTYFRDCDQIIAAGQNSEISIDNCLFDFVGGIGGNDVIRASEVDTSITVTECTFYESGTSSSHSIFYINGNGNEVELDVKGCYFYNTKLRAVLVEGELSGSVSIDQCFFKENNSYGGVITVNNEHTSEKLNLEIMNSTFYSNYINNISGAKRTTISVNGDLTGALENNISGKIVNSTFWNNLTYSTVLSGAVNLTGCDVDIICSTFLDNKCDDYPYTYPYALGIFDDANVRIVNSILANSTHDSTFTSCIIDDGGNFTKYGVIDIVDDSTTDNEVAGLFANIDTPAYVDGLIAGCDVYDYYEEITVLLITPNLNDGNLSADGTGVTPAGIDLPTTDQRGMPREGPNDVGSVSIFTVLYYMNGGSWDQYNGPMMGYSYGWPYKDIYDSSSNRIGVAVVDHRNPEHVNNPVHSDPIKKFHGWSVDPGAEFPDPGFMISYQEAVEPPEMGGVYYAVWGENNLVMFDLGDMGEPIYDRFVTADQIKFPNVGIIDGMSVGGWGTYPGGEVPWDPSLYIEGNVILYAKWTVATYEVTFDPNNGSESTSVSVNHGDKITAPSVTKEGHKLTAWVTSDDVEWDFTVGVTGNMTLTAVWEILIFEVTFDPTNETLPWIVMINWGETVSLPDEPTFSDHEFKGWFTGSDVEWDFDTPIKSDTVLYAQWVEIVPNGGPIDEEVVEILAATAVAVFASLGVIPVAASAAGATGTAGVAAQVATGNVFQQGMAADPLGAETTGEEKNRRTVVFNPMNGRSMWATTVFNGRQVDKPGNPNPPKGKMFSHWSESENGPPFSFLTPITKVTYLYAVYVEVGSSSE